MDIRDVLEKLEGNGYSLALVAKQSGVSYMRLYRFYKQDMAALSDTEQANIKAFAFVQPAFTRGGGE